MKQRKVQKHQGEKRQFTLIIVNYSAVGKKYRGDEIVMPSTSGYNLRPRRGAKRESRPPIKMRTQQGDQLEQRKTENSTTVPTSNSKQGQAARLPDEDVDNIKRTRKGKE
ncbi:hypothetical protein TNCV_4902401 [Trichonephila clavipes]|nr:hypothetical protein TNCV_4902401 [Trichonephila clavipes]